MQSTSTYCCIHTLVALICIWFELVSHNDNYFCNILRQWLRHYRPAGQGPEKGGLPPPPQKKYAIQVDIIRHFVELHLAHDILQHSLQCTTTYYCIHTLVALICISFELVSHNDNYLRNILRQWLRHYCPAGEGPEKGGLAPPQKKKLRYASQTIYIT